MRILLTNDDGVNARGLRLLEAVARNLSDDIWIVAPTEEQSGAGHSLTLTDAGAAAEARRAPLLGHRHPDRRGDAGARPRDEGFAARRDPVGDQPRRQSGRGRDLFGHGLGGDGRRACRRPLDRAQPGLFARRHGRHRAVRRRRGMGRAGARAAARFRDRARGPWSTSTSRRCRPTRCAGSASAGRACATTGGCGSSSAPIRAATIITGSASGRWSRRRAIRPTSKRSPTATCRSPRCTST